MDKDRIKNIISIALIILGVLVIAYKNLNATKFFERPTQSISKYSMDVNMLLAENGTANIEINPPTKLSYKTKKEIYEQRTKYVNKVFNMPKYKPKEEVFGQIEDNKPWIGLEAASCFWNFNTDRDKGVSEESVFLNNPMALISVEMPYYAYLYSNNCTSNNYFMPKRIELDENNKLITITYDVSTLYSRLSSDVQKKYIFVLNALNARDFGYQWGHASSSKNIKFKEKVIAKSAYYFLNYIHVGSSCGIRGGCNNGSPFQAELNFKISSLPASIDMKLWKNEPKLVSADSDINIRILFE